MTSAPPLNDQSPSATSGPAPSAMRSRRRLERAGGVASFIVGGTYIAGFGVMLAYLAPRGFTGAQGDPGASLTFLLQNQTAMYLWYLLIYLVAGAALVVLTLGVHDRLKHSSPALAPVTAAFGLIWAGLLLASGSVALVAQRAAVDLAASDHAEAVSTWSSLSIVQDALGGGIEVVGALWVLLTSVTAIRTHLLPRGLAVLGIAVGVAGALTLVPQVPAAASVFGLGFIAWYLWAGRTLLRS